MYTILVSYASSMHHKVLSKRKVPSLLHALQKLQFCWAEFRSATPFARTTKVHLSRNFREYYWD